LRRHSLSRGFLHLLVASGRILSWQRGFSVCLSDGDFRERAGLMRARRYSPLNCVFSKKGFLGPKFIQVSGIICFEKFQILRELERSHPPGMVFTFGSLQTPCLSDGTGRPDRQQSLAKLPSLRSGEILFLCPTHIPKGIDGQISFVLIRVHLMDRSCGIRQRTSL
jgi:hypothetical protein